MDGDDIKEIVEKCNAALSGINIMSQHFLGMRVERLFEIWKELDAEFNSWTDYYVFRYVQRKK